MRIGMVLQAHFPSDVRVQNEARSLSEAGHQVDLLCLAATGQKTDEVADRIHLLRQQRPCGALSRLNSLAHKAFFVDPFWLLAIRQYVRQHRPQALHVHDLPLTRTTLLVARRHGIPLVFDMHERWPERVLSWEAQASSLESLSTYSYRRLKALERDSLVRCDQVICVSEPDVLAVRQIGVPARRIALVPNYVDSEIFSLGTSPIAKRRHAQGSRWLIVYVGTIGFHRGLDVAIRAMPTIISVIPHARLVVGGNVKPEVRPWLQQAVADTDMEEHVELAGWIDYRTVPDMLSASRVVIALFKPTVPQSFSATHKLFQAMAMARPVIVSDVGDLRERIEAINCGLVVAPGDPHAFADAVIELYRNPQLAETLGRNGRQAVEQRYNWTFSGRRLVELYERIETGYGCDTNIDSTTSTSQAGSIGSRP